MSLFNLGEFESHSGKTLRFKIDCDALTYEDLQCLASVGRDLLPGSFGSVMGVPTGGARLANAFYGMTDPGSKRVLIVDDVLTTGASMASLYTPGAMGLVIFARGPCPQWVTPIFVLYDAARKGGNLNGRRCGVCAPPPVGDAAENLARAFEDAGTWAHNRDANIAAALRAYRAKHPRR